MPVTILHILFIVACFLFDQNSWAKCPLLRDMQPDSKNAYLAVLLNSYVAAVQHKLTSLSIPVLVVTKHAPYFLASDPKT